MEEFNELDALFKNTLSNAKVSPPAGVWEGIASSVSGSAATSSTWVLLSKWIAGVVLSGTIGYVAYTVLMPAESPLPEVVSTQEPAISSGMNDNPSENNESQWVPSGSLQESNNQVSQVKGTKPPQSTDLNPNSNSSGGIVADNVGDPNVQPDNIKELLAKMAERNVGPKSHSTGNASNGSSNPHTLCQHTLSIQTQKITNQVFVFSSINPTTAVHWSLGDGSSFEGFQISHEYPRQPNIYNVKALTIAENGCRDSAVYKVKVEGEKPVLTNVFTPNADGLNDEYYVDVPFAKKYELNIFDLAGNLVFHSDSQDKKWNGTINERNCPAGKYKVVFAYMYEGDDAPNVLYEVLNLTR